MSLRAWWARMRGTLRRDAALDRDMEREMAFHLEMSTQRNIDRGLAPEVAARQAKVSFGSVPAAREEAQEANRARRLENVLMDVRFAARSLRRSPSFALATMFTMALGIGASTAIFSVVDAVLLRPIAIPRPEDFGYFGWVWSKGGDIPSLTSLQYDFVRRHNRTLEAIASYSPMEARLSPATGSGIPSRGLHVADEFFRAIGFAPRLGRAFDATEMATAAPVIILSDATWRTQFGGDPGIVGRRVLLDDEPKTVIGVMSEQFEFPPAVGYDSYLLPFTVRVEPADEGHNTEVIARFRHDTDDAARDTDVQELSRRFATAYPTLAAPREGFKLYTHRDVYVGPMRRTLWVLFGAVTLLLLIACANTATLLLVRASSRQREVAVRASIGAGPGRILQQLLTEGFVLAAMSTVAGLLLGVLGLRGFLAVAPNELPAGMTPRLDGRVIAYAVGLSALTGIVFGLAAAIPSFRLRLQSGILAGARGTSGGSGRTREALVFLQTTAAVVLLAGATLLTVSFARLTSVDPGFKPEGVVAIRLGRMPTGMNGVRQAQLVDRVLERVRAVPGVEHAAIAPNLPLERGRNIPVDTREKPELAIGGTEIRHVSPGYFATLGILLNGRDFTRDDVEGSEPVAIVNQAFARHFWGAESPIGRTIQIGHFQDRWINDRLAHQTLVVGVAQDMHEIRLDRDARPTVLVARAQSGNIGSVILVRGALPQMAAVLRREVESEAAELTPTIEALTAVVRRSIAGPRFRSLLIGTFAGSALLLAAIGIYGVIAAVVEQRRREIGIRLSLGATRTEVTIGVVRRCLVAVGVGAGVGIFVYWGLRQSLSSMLYATSVDDPRLMAAVLAILGFVAVAAAWVPARGAARVDPAITLRLD